jgi:hypothetical protein
MYTVLFVVYTYFDLFIIVVADTQTLGLEFRVCGLGFRVYKYVSIVYNFAADILAVGCRVKGVGFINMHL